MKVERIECFVLRAPLGAQRFLSSQEAFPQRKSLLVRITTDDGLVGWGEGGQWGPAEPVRAAIEHVLAPYVTGQDPRRVGVLWETLYAHTRDFGQSGTYVEAISAIDIALWDVFGQSVGLPVHALLGGAFRERVTAYATGCYYRGEPPYAGDAALRALHDEVAGYAEAGFTALKCKIGLLPIADDLKRVATIRKAAGDGLALLADANHAYNAANALRVGRGMQEHGVRMFEEPVVPEDLEGYTHLRNVLDMAIAGGECSFTRYGFKRLFERGCVDIAQPDLCAAGGFSELQKIQALASSYGVMVMPHVWGSGVALAAALHAIAALPWQPYTHAPVPLQNEPMVEFDRNPNPLRDDLLTEPIRLVDGCLPVPQGPGLGVTVNEEVLRRYAA